MHILKLWTKSFSFPFFTRFGECRVQVTVGDDNDNSPRFTNLPNDTTVTEGQSANTAFFAVKVCVHKNGYVKKRKSDMGNWSGLKTRKRTTFLSIL